MNARFPYADVFGGDLPKLAPAGGLVAEAVEDPAAVMRRLASIRGLLRGASLRTVVRTLLAEVGLPDTLTFAQLHDRTGGVDVRILAVSLATLRLVVFSAGTSPHVRVADAMVASMSIPGVFAPADIPGYGPCVDGGVLDPLGLEVFRDDEAGPPATVWVGKAARYEPSRRADSIPSVLLSCLAACAQHTQRMNQERRTGRGYGPAMVSVSLGVREGCDERDVAVNSFDLLQRPAVADMLRDGLDSADGCVLTAFLLLVLSMAIARKGGPASAAKPA
jgi:predicted acylesterase/phospholipase RssA